MTDTTQGRAVPQQVRAAVRRAEILDAAREVIREDGIDKTTTAKVAERAEAAIGTVYRYFPDVHAILDEILPGRRQTHDVLLERADRVAAGMTAEVDDARGVMSLLSDADLKARQYDRRLEQDPDLARIRLVEAVACTLAALEAHDRAMGATS